MLVQSSLASVKIVPATEVQPRSEWTSTLSHMQELLSSEWNVFQSSKSPIDVKMEGWIAY